MNRTSNLRSRIRHAMLLFMFLFFPVSMNYMSPYVIIDGSSQGIISGSFVLFGSLFVSALFLGRAWCGWLCPAGALGEFCFTINDRRINGKHLNWIKWAIWVPWMGIIGWAAVSAGGFRSVDLLLDTVGGISVAGSPDRPIIFAYVIYYIVILLFAGLAVAVGRRAGCHGICWMAPFMIVGRKIRNRLQLPALLLSTNRASCTKCKTCTSKCPMSLDVDQMVQREKMENDECILCGSCVDACPTRSIRYSFSRKV